MWCHEYSEKEEIMSARESHGETGERTVIRSRPEKHSNLYTGHCQYKSLRRIVPGEVAVRTRLKVGFWITSILDDHSGSPYVTLQ